jgi:hypothetical protein
MMARKSNGIIDAQHRYAPCREAEIEPHFEELGDRDPVALIVSRNLQPPRCHGRAAGDASRHRHPKPEKGGRVAKGWT